jgi:hypothetical protein
MQVVAQLSMQDLPDDVRGLAPRADEAHSEPLVLAEASSRRSLPRWWTR